MFKNNFLWGGATAANQFEGGYNLGGRGLATSDTKTNGSMNKKRKHSFLDSNGKIVYLHGSEKIPKLIKVLLMRKCIIQVIEQWIFIIVMKMILLYLLKWVLSVLECQYHGHVFILGEMKAHLIKQV